METSLAVELINTVGFPIAMCIALFWFCNKTLNGQQELLNEFKDTLRDNTEVLRELSQQIKKGG